VTAPELFGPRQNQCQSCRARALGEGLLFIEQGVDSVFDLGFADEFDAIYQARHDLSRENPRRFDGDTFGECSPAKRWQNGSFERAFHGGKQLGLNADDLDVWVQCFGGDGATRNQPAASDGHDERVNARPIAEHFQGERSLSGHHEGVVERRHPHKPFARAQLEGELLRIVEGISFEQHVRSPLLGVRYFVPRRAEGHHDGRGDAQAPRMAGDGLRVVSGGGRYHAAPSLFVVQAEQFVERAALFESVGFLPVVELEIEVEAAQARVAARRPNDAAFDASGSGFDVREREGEISQREAALFQ